MIILKILILLLHFTIVPVAIGRLTTYRSSLSCNHNPFVVYIVGFFGELGIMYAVNTIITMYQDFTQEKQPVNGCFTIICFVYGALLVVSLLAYINKFLLKDDGEEIDDEDEDESIDAVDEESEESVSVFSRLKENAISLLKGNKYTWVYVVFFTLILVFQLYFAFGYQINQWSYDDYDYLVHSNDNIANNMVDVTHYATGAIPSSTPQRQCASWTTFISYLAVVTGFNVATICHSCLTIILLLIVYIVYFYVAQTLFKEFDNQMIFMCLMSMLFMFGLYSHYSVTFRVLCAIWQGKAVLAGVVVPFLMVYLPKVYKKKKLRNLFPLFVVSVGACSLTLMSCLVVGALAIVMGVTLCIYRKKITGVIPVIICGIGPVLQMIIFFAFDVFSVIK